MHKLDRTAVREPPCLARPRVGTFRELDRREKAEIRERLLEMQRDRCAYCERPTSGEQDGHVEHFRDQAGQSIHGVHDLAWPNMFWSCNDESSCGKHKDKCRKQAGAQVKVDPADLIGPCADDPHEFLRFGVDGTVAPHTRLDPNGSRRAAETVRAFNLDNPFLRRMRERVAGRAVASLAWLSSAGREAVRAYVERECLAIEGLPFESAVRQYLEGFR